MNARDPYRVWHIRRVWHQHAERGLVDPELLHYEGCALNGFTTLCGVVDDPTVGRRDEVPVSDRTPITCRGCAEAVRHVMGWPRGRR
jgi:hypothetical protein